MRWYSSRWSYLALAGLVVPSLVGLAVWHFFQKEYKNISLTINSNIQLVAVEGDKNKDLKILYNNKFINSLSALEITITNNGTSPIKKEDFSKPLQLIFNGKFISNPTILFNKPKQLEPCFKVVGDNVIELVPLLLNPGDEFKIRIDVADSMSSDTIINVTGRIVGVSNIEVVKKLPYNTTKNEPYTYIKYGLYYLILMAVSYFSVMAIEILRTFNKIINLNKELHLSKNLESKTN